VVGIPQWVQHYYTADACQGQDECVNFVEFGQIMRIGIPMMPTAMYEIIRNVGMFFILFVRMRE